MNLDGLWTRMPKNMSGGQKRRLDIVMGLIHEPRLVFLDEPTTGLDPQARANLWEHIRDLRARRGATVFLTTHYLDEADALSDRILIIDQGRIVAADTSDNLKTQVSGDLVDLELVDVDQVAEAARKLASLGDGRSEVEVDGRHVRGRVPRAGRSVQGLLRDLDRSGHRPGLHRGAPAHPRRRVPVPDRSLAARRRVHASRPSAPGEPAAPSDVPEGALQ